MKEVVKRLETGIPAFVEEREMLRKIAGREWAIMAISNESWNNHRLISGKPPACSGETVLTKTSLRVTSISNRLGAAPGKTEKVTS
jgi:hypothetical protein